MRSFEVVSDKHREHIDKNIILPTRSTINSAGYDFTSPIDIEIKPRESVCIITDVKVRMWDDEVLHIYPRSSFGIKKNLMLCNTVAVIDMDFFENVSNDGNIAIAYYNYGTETQYIKAGEKIAQGVFINFLKTHNDESHAVRSGGIGSTN